MLDELLTELIVDHKRLQEENKMLKKAVADRDFIIGRVPSQYIHLAQYAKMKQDSKK